MNCKIMHHVDYLQPYMQKIEEEMKELEDARFRAFETKSEEELRIWYQRHCEWQQTLKELEDNGSL
jgi:hypothetical protein